MLWEDCGRILEFWTRKGICVESSVGIFCRSLKDKNVEGSVEDRGLACKVSGGSLKTQSEPFVILN